jgi:H/ACA ribonucleoprotein complex subunit 4
MEEALSLLPKVVVRDSAVDALCHGANLTAPGVLKVDSDIKKGAILAVFTLKGEAVALGKALASTEEILDLKHGAIVGLERVLMERGTYPKVWKTGSKHEGEQA